MMNIAFGLTRAGEPFILFEQGDPVIERVLLAGETGEMVIFFPGEPDGYLVENPVGRELVEHTRGRTAIRIHQQWPTGRDYRDYYAPLILT